MSDVNNVMRTIQEEKVEMVDLRFTDFPGLWHHFSIPASHFGESDFEDGIGFDGSSIRGFQLIQESDMVLLPDAETAFLDPFTEATTLVIVCNVAEPITLERYSRDARYVAQKAENYLKQTGIAEVSYWGPEAEFYIFNDVRFDQNAHSGFYYLDSQEGIWNSGKEESPNLGYKVRHKQGYFPVPPMDSLQDLRSEMSLILERIGLNVEVHHHEVGTAGQGEIDMRYDSLTRMGDNMMKFKYVVKNAALSYGYTATFMPKPLFMDNGSGMHVHQSLWKGGENLFYDESGYALLSQMGLNYIGGLIAHTPALCAICSPTTNSYRRLVPGYEAPNRVAYSQRNRSAAVRIPVYHKAPATKRVEYRPPDPSCNAYLAFAAMLMAGIDGIQNRIDPGDPVDKDIYDLPPEEALAIASTPGSLEEALNALEEDHEFLLKGDVFTEDVIQMWLEYKRSNEVDQVRLRPHPYEFYLYYDI